MSFRCLKFALYVRNVDVSIASLYEFRYNWNQFVLSMVQIC